MRAGVALLILLMAAGWAWTRHEHRQGLAPLLLTAPDPALSAAEVASDLPSDAEFAATQWQPASEREAEAFAVLDRDYHCATAWQDAVNDRAKDDVVQQARLKGRSGLSEWHQMRILRPDGSVAAAFTRPGPRLATGY